MKTRLAVLLCCCLVAATGWAQPVRRGMLVDSRDECNALGGAWMKRGGWQFGCQMPLPRDECIRLGGAWEPLAGAPGNGVCQAAVSQVATERQCTQSGGTWGPPGSSMPLCLPGTAKAPVRKASDAGKVCDSQRDCTFGCTYDGPPKAEGANALGRCRPNSSQTGCFTLVEKGRLAGQVCVNN